MNGMFDSAYIFNKPLNDWDVAAPRGRVFVSSSRGSTRDGPLLSSSIDARARATS